MLSEEKYLLAPLVPLFDIPRPIDWQGLFKREAPLDVEIGFGIGEFLAHRATSFPERNIVGIEQIWERTYKALKKVTSLPENAYVQILHTDAWIAFERLFSLETIDSIFCLYPCPWPKKAHIKHRLFSQDFFRLINSRLKEGGEVTIVTDFYPFFLWVLEQAQDVGFQVQTDNVTAKYNTKFERKWVGGGQQEFFEIHLKKVANCLYEQKKDADLRVYKVKEFDPQTFRFNDQRNDPAIIFKDMVFDEQKKTALIHLIVSEKHLTQHFWVSVVRQKDVWVIAKAEGQNFFPTPGVAQAIELVFRSIEVTCT